jgi:ComF family protein
MTRHDRGMTRHDRGMTRHDRGMAPRLLSLLAPPLCWGCRAPARLGEPLCGRCRLTLRRLPAEPVLLGGIPVWAAVSYEGAARDLVRALKYRGAARVAEAMAAAMAACAPEDVLPRGSPRAALVPVPLHPARLRRRGYDQAAMLAADLARRTGLPTAPVLQRAGAATPQVGRGRSARLAGISGTIRARARSAAPELAVLVDDVVTTGATLSACADALGRAGAGAVTAVAYARTPGR